MALDNPREKRRCPLLWPSAFWLFRDARFLGHFDAFSSRLPISGGLLLQGRNLTLRSPMILGSGKRRAVAGCVLDAGRHGDS
jgi:hypothetical protein